MTTASDICEHGDIRAACIDCLQAPRPFVPKSAVTAQSRGTKRPDSLSGTKDISVPVYEVDPYLGDNDWLIAQGYPHDLRPGGFVYLRNDDSLKARASVMRMEWREERPWRTGDGAEAGETAEPGWVFILDPSTWERVEIPLNDLAEKQRSGFRYLMTNADGGVEHMIAGDDVPEGDWHPAATGSDLPPTSDATNGELK